MGRSRIMPVFFMGLIAAVIGALPDAAMAAGTTTVSGIAANVVNTSSQLPGLLAGLAYLLGLVFAGMGILKIKEHVSSPQQTPLREALVRLVAGGALFALPAIYRAMKNSIFAPDDAFGAGATMAGVTDKAGFNNILRTIVTSFEQTPGAISGFAYLIGLVLGIAGILKIKEHVENPAQTPLREGIIRFGVGGGLFALPAVYYACQNMINGGLASFAAMLVGDAGHAGAGHGATCGGAMASGLGSVICSTMDSTDTMPIFLSAASYIFGLVLGVWGLMKLKDHVLNPQQHPIWEPVSRFAAAGAFFSLPYVVSVFAKTLGLDTFAGFGTTGTEGTASGAGLDAMLVRFVGDVYGPMLWILTAFGYIAGIVLIMIGISRLLKSAQEGPRGPGGLGTIMTFLTGGALISMAPTIGRASVSLFATDETKTKPELLYTTGMSPTEVGHVHAVISAVIQFMIILGVVSFVRGIFIIRGVSEGNSQASMMAGVTHIVGGALAVNLGPVINAVTTTLGLTAYGVKFN